MKAPEHISLLGLMGSGKSTIGERLARALRRRCIDLDARIYALHGPVGEIFAARGENGFRELEYAVLETALQESPAIISPGGGILTHAPSRELLGRTIRVYLDVSIPTLVRRLSHSSTVRPLVGRKPTIARVTELWEARHVFYEEAEIRITSDAPVERIVSEILDQLSTRHGVSVKAEN